MERVKAGFAGVSNLDESVGGQRFGIFLCSFYLWDRYVLFFRVKLFFVGFRLTLGYGREYS